MHPRNRALGKNRIQRSGPNAPSTQFGPDICLADDSAADSVLDRKRLDLTGEILR